MVQNKDILDIKPKFYNIGMTTGTLIGTNTYNQASFTYNQSGLQYGGLGGRQDNPPKNLDILNL